MPLTAYGEEQARALQPVPASRQFALVLVSPLLRAWRTAALAGLAGAEAEPDLQEWDYGSCEGLTRDEIRRRDGADWDVWRNGPAGGETIEEVAGRVDRVLARVRVVLAASGGDADVVLVAHGHLLRLLATRWVALPPAAGSRLALGAAAYSILGWEHETAVVWRWNVASPLDGG